MENPVSATAYERKAELGGGFRAVVVDKRGSKQRYESPILGTIEAARHWARVKVDHLMDGAPWRPGYSYRPYWNMHVWVR